jgi:hypothetical protein
MKTIKLSLLLITFIFLASAAEAQSFTGITWKVNECYLDSIPVGSGTLDSLRYHFRGDGILEMRQPQMPETQYLSYAFNPVNFEITLFDEDNATKILKVIYTDFSNLIFTTSDTNPATGIVLKSEFRMIPVNTQ